ncbi:hypothetical protein D3C87_701790 [compost metagenome]
MVGRHCEAQDADAAQHRLLVVVGQGGQLGELEPLALEAYQGGQQGLIVLVEAGQIRVLQNVGGVAMDAAVVDGQANLMQPRRPAEDGAIGLDGHLPGIAQGIKQGQHALLHPGGLALVDVIVGAEGQGGALANVVVLQPLLELIEQPLAQGAVGVLHPIDGQ